MIFFGHESRIFATNRDFYLAIVRNYLIPGYRTARKITHPLDYISAPMFLTGRVQTPSDASMERKI